MAAMRDPQIGVIRASTGLRFTVSYTARFSQDDLAVQEGFAEYMALCECDRGEALGEGAEHLLNVPVRTFKPMNALETRGWTLNLTDEQLDTVAGGEGICAVIRLRRNIHGVMSDTLRTPIFPVSRPVNVG